MWAAGAFLLPKLTATTFDLLDGDVLMAASGRYGLWTCSRLSDQFLHGLKRITGRDGRLAPCFGLFFVLRGSHSLPFFEWLGERTNVRDQRELSHTEHLGNCECPPCLRPQVDLVEL